MPSGGALYPLKIYVLVERAQDGLTPGYYEYDAEQNLLVLFDNEVDEEQLKYCFNQEKMPFDSAVQIIIAADLGRQTYKYANRGYRLTLIEAGHVAENISFYCAEQGLGACEMGGVQDEPLKNELGFDATIWPILAIPIGYPADEEKEDFDKIRYVEENVGKTHAVKEAWASTFGSDGAFFGAAATYCGSDGEVQYTGATSPSYADAVFKATVEGYERWFSGQVRTDFRGSAKQIPGKWLDPRKIVPLTAEQIKRCGLKPFDDGLVINWTRGMNYDGSDILVPSDLVYYGYKNDENRIYFGNSSGVAAHFDFEEARKRAILELIERDALMVNWYSRESPLMMDEDSLPVHVRKRVEHWEKQGRKMIILLMPSNYGTVFEAIVISEEYPCFVSGAAAAIEREYFDNAVFKAIQEAEYSLLLALKYPDKNPIDPRKVETPADHGKVYHFRENAKQLDWLWRDSKKVDYRLCCSKSCESELERLLEIVTVDLSVENVDLKVARVISPRLVPISFGFDLAHYAHPIIKNGQFKCSEESLRMPHYFA